MKKMILISALLLGGCANNPGSFAKSYTNHLIKVVNSEISITSFCQKYSYLSGNQPEYCLNTMTTFQQGIKDKYQQIKVSISTFKTLDPNHHLIDQSTSAELAGFSFLMKYTYQPVGLAKALSGVREGAIVVYRQQRWYISYFDIAFDF